MPQDTEASKRCMATINERVRVIQLQAEGEIYRSISEDTGISKTRPKELLSIRVIPAKSNPHHATVDLNSERSRY
jgi:hypothetical protein